MVPQDPHPGLLFTAFEPSGDDHASAVIAELRSRYPDLPIHAWGGPRMQQAGATIVERTGHDAVMGMPGLKKIIEHKKINARVARWLADHPGVTHIPVDSPAANFPICKAAKKRGHTVVHLVAPQVWAWGTWRIRKLRRLTDLVLCLLPFEQPWFDQRRVPARFIGHPLFDRPLDPPALDSTAKDYPTGQPKLAIMPGSRPGELQKNFPLMLEVFRALRHDKPGLSGVVAATTPSVAEHLQAMARKAGGWPEGLHVVADQADAVIRWCDFALVVSGTVSLQIAKQRKPMVIFYKSSPLLYILLARWILTTEFFTLPNLIAGREIVPELVPHFQGPGPIIDALRSLMDDQHRARTQTEELDAICQRFDGLVAAQHAADAIEKLVGLRQSPEIEPS